MNPKHIKSVPENRKAVAPYNFVELPEKVVSAEPFPEGNCYHRDRHTGRIECTLTTSSPLYIRCGLTPDDFAAEKSNSVEELKQCSDEERRRRTDFFKYPREATPTLPGSSLRGMLRTLVEIVSFSKISKVSDQQKFFFRAVAADKDDPLAKPYKDSLKKVKVGYLVKQNGSWFIRPAKKVDNLSFVWIKDKEVQKSIQNFVSLKEESYSPQYRMNISFEDTYLKNGKRFAGSISNDPGTYQYVGVLVTSGNMAEGGEAEKTPRKNHCLVREPDESATLVKISDDAVRDYCNSLTPFQKENPFDKDRGILKSGRCIFYCEARKGEDVTQFGQSPNFRIPYIPKGQRNAASAVDFIPEFLQDIATIDIASAIFGWVREGKNEKKQRAGRVSISDAKYQSNEDGIWHKDSSDHTVIPQILASPKPTTFQHYLVQPEGTKAKKENLKHYASKPIDETVIRGHKLYWHKGSNPDFKHPNPNSKDVSDSQLTQIKPIKKGVIFKFTIHFENLSNVELGALMWILDIAQDDNYRLKLGMGKPLGMGAVKIESELYLCKRVSRYSTLFEGNNWNSADILESDPLCKQRFENYILEELKQTGKLEDIPRIQMLREILKWQENPGQEYLDQRRYLEIKREQQPRLGDDPNEYKKRRVLPTPLNVDNKSNNQRPSPEPHLSKPSQSTKKPLKKAVKQFEEGQVVQAKVMSVEEEQIQKGKKKQRRTIITYEIEGSDCQSREEVNKKKVDLTIGDTVEVRIVKAKDSSIRKVEHLI